MEEEVQEEDPLADLRGKGICIGIEGGGAAKAFETSRAEALHERDRNSMGALGLSGK